MIRAKTKVKYLQSIKLKIFLIKRTYSGVFPVYYQTPWDINKKNAAAITKINLVVFNQSEIISELVRQEQYFLWLQFKIILCKITV